jgi:hypothetical protein
MTNTKKTILKILGGLVIAYFAITAIASTGTVVDDKGKPIKGAQIIAYWNGNAGFFVQPTTQCYHLESTESDENGHFSVSTFSGGLNPFMLDRERSIGVFVPGYELKISSNYEDLKFVAGAPTGSKKEQFEKVNRRFKGGGCGNEKARLPFIKAIHAELLKLAETKEEKEICDSLFFSIESAEFGYESALKRSTQRNISNASKGIK